MNKVLAVFSITLLILVSGQAFATPEEDAAWVAQCEKDNAKEGAPEGAVTRYCNCMNQKMGETDKKSITEWESSHQTEIQQCDAEAGWK
jgi:hypothetical protein